VVYLYLDRLRLWNARRRAAQIQEDVQRRAIDHRAPRAPQA
jgi:hypothetical protein